MSDKKIITDLSMPNAKERGKAIDTRVHKKEKTQVVKDPLKDVWVTARFHCPECITNYGEYIRQDWLRRMPKTIPWKGKQVAVRRPDGTILKMCDNCIKDLKKFIARKKQSRLH